jgi:hypothetical protein
MGLVQDEDMEWVNNDVEFLFFIGRLTKAAKKMHKRQLYILR